ncbi:MAG: hypothetical protein WBH56_12225 [Bacteroidota bacterium]
MYDKSAHSFCDEFYIVEKTIEVVVNIKGESETIRIDAMKNEKTGKYCTRAYRDEQLTVQPTYPKTEGKYDRNPEDCRIWVDYDLPWTDRNTANEALRQAIDLLRQQISK